MPLRRLGPRLLAPAAGAAVLVVVAGCAGGATTTSEEADVAAPEVITVTSPAFGDGEAVPVQFTCDGAEQSPPLEWDGVPADAASLALVVDDPDAPRGTFVHWVVLDLPPGSPGVAAGEVPPGAVQATNSAGTTAYVGPCPPSGTHHYRFTLYALAQPTGLGDGADLADALAAVRGAATARGRLVATYTRG